MTAFSKPSHLPLTPLGGTVFGLAFFLALVFSMSEAVHLHVMQPLIKKKPNHVNEVSDRANFALVNDISGFVPLSAIALVSMVCGGVPSTKASFWLFVLTAGILQAVGLNTITRAVKLGKLTWLLALDSVSPVIQAGVAFFFQHQQPRMAECIGIGMIAIGLVIRFRMPKKNTAPNGAPSDVQGWHKRWWRYVTTSMTVLYLLAKLVWIPYTPVVQEACYSMHKGWATPAFVMSLVFLIGATLSFSWNLVQQKRSREQGDQLPWGKLVCSTGVSSWRYFSRFRRVFTLNAVILTFQQFAELTALVYANVASVSAVSKLTLVFLMIIRLINRARGKEDALDGDDDGYSPYRKWSTVGLLVAGTIVMAF